MPRGASGDEEMTNKVLCISSSAVIRLYRAYPNAWFCSETEDLQALQQAVRRSSFFIERARAESDERVTQLIPACVISNGEKILCIERARDANRVELKSRWTAVFGGHVDEKDDSDYDRWQTIVVGAAREVREELGIDVAGQLQLAGLAIDPTNQPGRLHLGIIFYFRSDLNVLHLRSDLDLGEFNLSSSKVVHLFSPKDIFHVQDRFDPWSTLFLRSSFARNTSHRRYSEDVDLPLLRAAH